LGVSAGKEDPVDCSILYGVLLSCQSELYGVNSRGVELGLVVCNLLVKVKAVA
jgi:hypothetical protein